MKHRELQDECLGEHIVPSPSSFEILFNMWIERNPYWETEERGLKAISELNILIADTCLDKSVVEKDYIKKSALVLKIIKIIDAWIKYKQHIQEGMPMKQARAIFEKELRL